MIIDDVEYTQTEIQDVFKLSREMIDSRDDEIQRLRDKHQAIINEYEHRRDECTGFAGVLYDLAKDALQQGNADSGS